MPAHRPGTAGRGRSWTHPPGAKQARAGEGSCRLGQRTGCRAEPVGVRTVEGHRREESRPGHPEAERRERPCTRSGDRCGHLGWVHPSEPHPLPPCEKKHRVAQRKGAGKLSAGAVASGHRRGLGLASWPGGQPGPASHLRTRSPSPGRKPAAHGYRAGAPASKAPRPRATARSVGDRSDAGRRAQLSQRGKSSHRSELA